MDTPEGWVGAHKLGGGEDVGRKVAASLQCTRGPVGAPPPHRQSSNTGQVSTHLPCSRLTTKGHLQRLPKPLA